MSTVLRRSFATFCRETRMALDITQQQLADAVGVSRGYVAVVEAGRANPTLAMVERFGDALGVDLRLVGRPPVIIGRSAQDDLVHAWCSGYVDRRLRHASVAVAREVEVVHGRSHGWIDLLAFDPRTASLFLIEIKTRLDDLGATERQLAWYEREAFGAARALGWAPRRLNVWLLFLASDEVDAAISVNRHVLGTAFPSRAGDMLTALDTATMPAMRGVATMPAMRGLATMPAMRGLATMPAMLGLATMTPMRGLAMIDPRSRRRDWLIRSRVDGRRGPAPFRDYADAASRIRA